MPDINVANTSVLLIGTSAFSNWRELDVPNIRVNLREMKALFTNPAYCGIPPNKIKCLDNPNLEDASNSLYEFFDAVKSRNETIILYYSGHGLQSTKAMDELFLSTSNIREKTFEASCLRVSDLRRMFSESIASRKILILDCCYAGKIAKGFLGSGDSETVNKLNDFEGTYILAASSELERARFDPHNPNSPTKFTGRLVEIIKEGIEYDQEYCTLSSIYSEIRTSFNLNKDGPKPIQIGLNNIGGYPLFRNCRFHEDHKNELRNWTEVLNVNTVDAYGRFLKSYPHSVYSDAASKAIEKLQDEAAWLIACEKHTITAYREYSSRHSLYLKEAALRVKLLDQHQREEVEFQQARKLNSKKALENYLRQYPNGRFGDECKKILKKIKTEETQQQKNSEVKQADSGNATGTTKTSSKRILINITVLIGIAVTIYFIRSFIVRPSNEISKESTSELPVAFPPASEIKTDSAKFLKSATMVDSIKSNSSLESAPRKQPNEGNTNNATFNDKSTSKLQGQLLNDFYFKPVNWNKVKQYINEGADLNTIGKGNQTPIEVAASENQYDAVTFLVSKKADFGSSIYHAIKNGYLEMAKYLYSKGAIISAQDLMMAAERCNIPFLKWVLDKSPDAIHGKDDANRNCLFYVLFNDAWTNSTNKLKEEDRVNTLKFLVSVGANTKVHDKCGNSLYKYYQHCSQASDTDYTNVLCWEGQSFHTMISSHQLSENKIEPYLRSIGIN